MRVRLVMFWPVMWSGLSGTLPATAQTGLDPSLEITAATRGMLGSKGLAQTEGPQLLVRAELALSGTFVAAYGKNEIAAGQEGAEIGVLLGHRFGIAGFQLSAHATYKRLVGIGGPVDDEAMELNFTATRTILPRIAGRMSVTYSPDELGATRHSIYVETGLTADLGHGLALSGNLSRRERAGGPDYTAFNLGVTQTLLPGISADLRYYDTAQSALGEIYHSRIVGSLRARF